MRRDRGGRSRHASSSRLGAGSWASKRVALSRLLPWSKRRAIAAVGSLGARSRPARPAATAVAGMNWAPDLLLYVVFVVLCVRAVCALAGSDVAGAPSGIWGSRVENRPGYRTVRARIQPP